MIVANQPHASGTLDLPAQYSQTRVGTQSGIGPKRVTSNTVVVLLAIVVLAVLILFLDLKIRALTSQSFFALAAQGGIDFTTRGNTAKGSSGTATPSVKGQKPSCLLPRGEKHDTD